MPTLAGGLSLGGGTFRLHGENTLISSICGLNVTCRLSRCVCAVAVCTAAVNSICDLCLSVNTESAALWHNELCQVSGRLTKRLRENETRWEKNESEVGDYWMLDSALFHES